MKRIWLVTFWLTCLMGVCLPPVRAEVDPQFVGRWQTFDPERANSPVDITITAEGKYHSETHDLLHNKTESADGEFSAAEGHWTLTPIKGKSSSGTYEYRAGLLIMQTETAEKPRSKGLLGGLADRLRSRQKGRSVTTYWKHSTTGPARAGDSPSAAPDVRSGKTRADGTRTDPNTGAVIRNEAPALPPRSPVVLREGDIPRAMELFWLHEYATAFPYLLAAAKAGNAEAAVMVGRIYIKGVGAPQDTTQGVSWIRYSAEHGDPDGQMAYAQMVQRGVGVSQSEQETLAWYRKAAAQNYARAEYNLAEILQKQNNSEYKTLLHRAILHGLGRAAQTLRFLDNPMACSSYQTGIRALDASNFAQALTPLQQAAKLGLADAKTMLGWMYENGKGVAKNPRRAFDYYSQAASAGDDKAQSNLGALYETGNGVAKNETAAASWYAKSAAQSNEAGAFRLARAYEFGIGVPQSREKAVELYHVAGRLGSLSGAYYAIWLRDPTNVDFRTGADQGAYIEEMNRSFARAHAQIWRLYGRAKEWEGTHPGADPEGNPFRH